MVFRVEDIKAVCKVLSQLSDPVSSSVMSQVIEMYTNHNKLYFHISDMSFDFITTVDVMDKSDLYAVVEAPQFLALVSKITTETVEMSVSDTALMISANGTYKLPLIYKEKDMLKVPHLELTSVNNEWDMNGDFLNSIYLNNFELCASKYTSSPVQKMVFLDNEGAVSFSTRACINSYVTDMPVKLLLPTYVVKTFPLYKKCEKVHVKFGYEIISDTINQPRIVFEADNYIATYCLPYTDEQLGDYPVDDVRALGKEEYSYCIMVGSKELKLALDRIGVFTKADESQVVNIHFESDKFTILAKGNKEIIYYDAPITSLKEYDIEVDLRDIQSAVSELMTFTSVHFGNDSAISFAYGNVCNVVSLIGE